MNLMNEIAKFWEWANKTPFEYSMNRGYGELECDYPNWKNLYQSIDRAIEKLNDNYNDELAELLIQGLAIDNESELVLEKIESNLINKSKFFEQVVNSNQPQAKWQIAELLKNVNLSEKKEILLKLIREQDDKYVKRRALISLNKIDKKESIAQAKQFINDKDDYLRMVSLEIIERKIKY